MDEIEVIPALSRALSHEKHHSEWTCSFQNGNIKAKLTILDVPLFDSAHSDNIPVGRVHLQQDNTFC